MSTHQILASLAGFHRNVLPPTSSDHPYRLVIPGLNRDVPYYWDQHEEAIDRRYPNERNRS